jgi:hypothetical protein
MEYQMVFEPFYENSAGLLPVALVIAFVKKQNIE